MKNTDVFILSIISLLFCFSCASAGPVTWNQEPIVKEAKKSRPQGLGFSVAVAPVVVVQPVLEEGGKTWAVDIDKRELQREIVAALKEVPVFVNVREIPVLDIARAKEAGADLMLKVTLENCTGSYAGTNNYFVPNMVLWGIVSPIAAMFIPDESYSVNAHLSAVLVDTSNESIEMEIWKNSSFLEETKNLNDWERGPTIWDIFFGAPFYTSWNQEKVATLIMPKIVDKIKVELASGILKELNPPKCNVAIVAGINICGLADAPELKYAEKDAEEFAAALSKNGFSKVFLMTGEKCTKITLEDTLRKLAQRKDIIPEKVLVYFAGCGLTKVNEENTCSQYLLMYSPIPGGEILIDDVVSLLNEIPATSKILIIDAGFGGKSGRLYKTEIPGGVVLDFSSNVKESEVGVLLSCGAKESSYEFDSFEHGVFTNYLIKSMGEAGDINRDKSVTIGEILKKISWHIARYVRDNIKDDLQQPIALGSNAEEKELILLSAPEPTPVKEENKEENK
ncbi:MAG: caspase family protein [Planctomycetota bacterium]